MWCNAGALAVDFGKAVQQVSQVAFFSVFIFAMVRIDVLAEQIDFQAAFAGQSTSLLQNVFNRARIFGSPGIGNDAVGTEIVAAFLNGQKSAGAGAVILGQKVKFGFGRKFGIDDCLAFLPPDPFKNFGRRWYVSGPVAKSTKGARLAICSSSA